MQRKIITCISLVRAASYGSSVELAQAHGDDHSREPPNGTGEEHEREQQVARAERECVNANGSVRPQRKRDPYHIGLHRLLVSQNHHIIGPRVAGAMMGGTAAWCSCGLFREWRTWSCDVDVPLSPSDKIPALSTRKHRGRGCHRGTPAPRSRRIQTRTARRTLRSLCPATWFLTLKLSLTRTQAHSPKHLAI